MRAVVIYESMFGDNQQVARAIVAGLTEAGVAAEAIGHYRRAAELNPFDMAAVLGLARALNAAGDREAALEEFRRAAGYQHRHVFYREQLGVQLRLMGRDEEALETFRKNVEDRLATDVSRMNIRALERKRAKAAPAP